MPLSKERKAEMMAMDLPSEDQIRDQTHIFLSRSGLLQGDLARMMGYSDATISRFLAGSYDWNRNPGNSVVLCAKLHEVMQQHDTAFAVKLDHTHYETSDYRQIHEAALSAMQGGTAYIVDGPPGTQKTESFRRIEHAINSSGKGRAVYVYARNHHAPLAFLAECCREAGIPNRGNIDTLIRKLRFFLSKRRTVFMVDEAQHLDRAGLEVLRQLLDLPPYFGVLLGGSHDLTQRLSHWQMEQWRSRVRKTFALTGPTDQEAYAILRAELGQMADNECAEVVRACQSAAQRTSKVQGKTIATTYTYTSARDLFGAIERTKELLAQDDGQKVGAA